jgi:hypothetical protein
MGIGRYRVQNTGNSSAILPRCQLVVDKFYPLTLALSLRERGFLLSPVHGALLCSTAIDRRVECREFFP